MKKCEGIVVKISAQSQHFSALVVKELQILLLIVNFGFLHLYLDSWIRNPDLDSERRSGSRIPNADPYPGSRPKLNVIPTRSRSGPEALDRGRQRGGRQREGGQRLLRETVKEGETDKLGETVRDA